MSELIKREDAIKITWQEPQYYDPINALTEVREKIRALPTVDAVPVVHAYWTTKRTWQHDGEIYCSACKNDAPTEGDYRQVKTKYCPNCVARMKTVTDCHTFEESEQ